MTVNLWIEEKGWECISTKCLLPVSDTVPVFPQLPQDISNNDKNPPHA